MRRPDSLEKTLMLGKIEGRRRRGSDEVGTEPSVLPSRETGVWGTFGGCMKGVRYCFALQGGTWDFP